MMRLLVLKSVLVVAPFYKSADTPEEYLTGNSAVDRELFKLRTSGWLNLASAKLQKQQEVIFQERLSAPDGEEIWEKIRATLPFVKQSRAVFAEEVRQSAEARAQAEHRLAKLKAELATPNLRPERRLFIAAVLQARGAEEAAAEVKREEQRREEFAIALRNSKPVKSLFNWDGACVLNSLHLALIHLEMAPTLLSGTDSVSEALRELKNSQAAISDSEGIRRAMGRDYEYVRASDWGGTCSETYIESLISKIPKLREACSCVVQDSSDASRQVTESVHYLVAASPASIEKLIEQNSYAFLTLPKLLVFVVDKDWFVPAPYVTGLNSVITITDLQGRKRMYRLSASIDESGEHATVNVRQGQWYKINNTTVRRVSRGVNKLTVVFFFEALEAPTRKRNREASEGRRVRPRK